MMLGGWPFRLAIHQDELLSSFLVRSAHAHGSSPYIFFNMFWPGRAIWNRDIDRDPDSEWLRELAQLTGVPFPDLQASSLLDTRSWLSPRKLRKGDTPLLLSSSVFHTTRRMHALQYCPKCLATEPVYFKISWRLGFALTCDQHRAALQDGCPSCDAPLIPHQTQPSKFASCFRCQQALSVTGNKYDFIPESVLDLEQRMREVLALGETHKIFRNTSVQDVFGIIRTLLSVSTSRIIQTELREQFNLPQGNFATNNLQFEHARWSERVQLLETVAHWIGDWPASFFQGAAGCGITQTTFSRLYLPASLREQIAKLPSGFSRTHIYVPILITPEMSRLKRRDPVRYRNCRAERMLKAGGYR